MTMHYLQDTVWDQIGAALTEDVLRANVEGADTDTIARMTLLAGGVPSGAITKALVSGIIAAADHPADPESEIQIQLAEANILPLSVRREVEGLAV